MQKAICGSCESGHFRTGVYQQGFEKMIKQHKALASHDITRRRLMLSSRDSTTGWCAKRWEDHTIEGVFATRGASTAMLAPGMWYRFDAVLFTADPVEHGDEIKVSNRWYEAKSVELSYLGDSFSHRTVGLSYLPMHHF